jgi:hypothetical protein
MHGTLRNGRFRVHRNNGGATMQRLHGGTVNTRQPPHNKAIIGGLLSTLRVAYCTAVVLLALVPKSAYAYDCPVDLNGHYAAGMYDFRYQSWSSSTERVFVYCVRNHHKLRSVYVEWEHTGLKGFIAPEGIMSARRPSGDTPRSIHATLWFGARPDKLDADTEVPSGSGTGDSDITTTARIWVPSGGVNAVAQLPDDAFVSRLEENPSLLVQVDFQFNSRPISNNESGTISAVRQSCIYRYDASKFSRREKVRLRIEDKTLHQTVFRQSDDFPMPWNKTEIAVHGDSASISEKTDHLKRYVTSVLIVSEDSGRVLGAMPITYYGD